MTGERDALLRAVCAAPEDARPRLIFADWLDEHGEPERAEFIRVQCELAKRPTFLVLEPGQQFMSVNGPTLTVLRNDGTERAEYDGSLKSVTALRSRERELLSKHIGPWADFLPDELVTRQCPYCEGQGPDWETGIVECRQCESTGRVPDYDGIDFRRGFVEEITCPWNREHIAAIQKATPLRCVRLTTAPEIEWVNYYGQASPYPADRVRLRGSPDHIWTPNGPLDGTREIMLACLAAEFPGVEFGLPVTFDDFPIGGAPVEIPAS